MKTSASPAPRSESSPAPAGGNFPPSNLPQDGGDTKIDNSDQFQEAISLIEKIKLRYADKNASVFKEFLEILQNYQKIQSGDATAEQATENVQDWF